MKRRTRLVLFTLIALFLIAALVLVTAPDLSSESLLTKPLSSPHSHLAGENHCQDCHVAGAEVSEDLCLKCHEPLSERIAAKTGFHAQVEGKCWECHSEHQGREFVAIKWPPPEAPFKPIKDAKPAEAKDFPHEQGAGFALAGSHEPLACEACHKTSLLSDEKVVAFKLSPEESKGLNTAKPDALPESFGQATFLGVSNRCAGCHQDAHRPSQGDDCAQCHGEQAWKPASKFDHDETRYPLVGKHKDESVTKCEECHLQAPPSDPPPQAKPPVPTFAAVVAKNNPRRFRGVGFGQAPATPVSGDTLPGCVNCHENVHRKQSQAFGDCEACHTPAEWDMAPDARFDHDATSFKLEGKHKDVSCAKCHGGEKLNGPVRETCLDCHKKDYDEHHKGAFDRELALGTKRCEDCHDVRDWKNELYPRAEHADVTQVALIDKHGGECQVCHQEGAQITALGKRISIPRLPPEPRARSKGVVGPLEKDCAACHGEAHQGRFARELKKTCIDCHDYKQWHLAELDNEGHARLGFPIEGAHVQVKCEGCHGGRTAEGGLRKLSLADVRVQGCVVCHEDVHQGQFGAQPKCGECHTEQVFVPSTYDEVRHASARLPLRDAHKAVPCEVCHVRDMPPPPDQPAPEKVAQRFKWPDGGREVGCVRCHEDVHAGQFRQSCSSCHGEDRFVPSTFEVQAGHRRIGFPLQGPHDTDCNRCHVPQLKHGKAVTYHGTPQDCAGCHLDVHLGQFARKRTGCQACHVIEDWKPSRFDHDKCRFPLAGAHAEVECGDCHLSAKRTFPDGKQRAVVHYYPIEGRDCGDCHQNPHAKSKPREQGKQGKPKAKGKKQASR
ncbi:MAG TPA: hypothetical protein DEA08_02020 [Planctomycetes bacterium]|nr:hypothetical protein [Planctomycetota bacterium]